MVTNTVTPVCDLDAVVTIILDEYILPALARYLDQYHWNFPFATRVINMYYGTEYTVKQIKVLYQQTTPLLN